MSRSDSGSRSESGSGPKTGSGSGPKYLPVSLGLSKYFPVSLGLSKYLLVSLWSLSEGHPLSPSGLCLGCTLSQLEGYASLRQASLMEALASLRKTPTSLMEVLASLKGAQAWSV